jgi:hypothetical protein
LLSIKKVSGINMALHPQAQNQSNPELAVLPFVGNESARRRYGISGWF